MVASKTILKAMKMQAPNKDGNMGEYRGATLSTHPRRISTECIPKKDWTYDAQTHGSTIQLKLPNKDDASVVYKLLAKDYGKLTTHFCDA